MTLQSPNPSVDFVSGSQDPINSTFDNHLFADNE